MKKTFCFAAAIFVGLLVTGCTINPGQGKGSGPIVSDSVATYTVRFYLDNELVKTVNDVKDGSKINPPSDSELPDGYIVNYWYVNEGSLKSPWSFSGGTVTSDLDLCADFNYETYTVNLINKDNGSTDATVTYKQQYDFSQYYQYNESYRLQSLKDADGKYYSAKGVWGVTHGGTLYPVWQGQINYLFCELYEPNPTNEEAYIYSTYGLNEVENSNPASLSGDSSAITGDLEDPKKEGYRFEGWWLLGNGRSSGKDDVIKHVNNKKITTIKEAFFGTSDDSVCGLFSKLYSISVSVNSSSGRGGKVEFVGEQIKSACYKDSITVKAIPDDGYMFYGWYDTTKLVSAQETYSFTMPASDCTLSAKFITKAEEAGHKALGIEPTVSDDGKTLTYGLYPQTHVSDAELISLLNGLTEAESNGWYLLNGVYYAKKSAKLGNSTYCEFDDGTIIVSGMTYWFRCELIEWKVLSLVGGTCSVVSSVSLDANCYDNTLNKYEDSEIREWLNGTFYNSAFALGKDHIQTTEVDNSVSTTEPSSKSNACANTLDNVYLLSYKDYLNTQYFADISAKCCKTTEWARASGALYSNSTDYANNALYWTRSLRCFEEGRAWCVSIDGGLESRYVGNSGCGVRPALTLAIS